MHRGLINDEGQYNCFLNVVIQSLWHLTRFREAMLSNRLADGTTAAAPSADQRVATALQNIFHAFANVRVGQEDHVCLLKQPCCCWGLHGYMTMNVIVCHADFDTPQCTH